MRETAALTFAFADHRFTALPEQALWWAGERTLIVADLHLEKASWYARGGQFLPPYDSDATLARLTALANEWDPAQIVCLGDSFHDPAGLQRLSASSQRALARLGARHHLVWVAGNHDGLLRDAWGGTVCDVWRIHGITLRHAVDVADSGAEISGHYHPKWRLNRRGRGVSRPCFVRGDNRLILPAFGSLTGGLCADDPAICGLFRGPVTAMVPTSTQLCHFAVDRLAVTAR